MEFFKRKQSENNMKDEALFMSAPNLVYQSLHVACQSKEKIHEHNGKMVSNFDDGVYIKLRFFLSKACNILAVSLAKNETQHTW